MSSIPPLSAPDSQPEPKKRGRPATGRRSDPEWIGRTFYVRKETDLDTEGELFALKRQGVELNKSELVDKLLAAWVKWRESGNSEFPTGELLPIRKPEEVDVEEPAVEAEAASVDSEATSDGETVEELVVEADMISDDAESTTEDEEAIPVIAELLFEEDSTKEASNET